MPNDNNWLSFKLPETLLDEIEKIHDVIEENHPNFKKMPRSGLHMTVFFFGEKLRNRNLKLEIEGKIEKFFSNLNSELKFNEYIYFPEDKKSCIVASYKIDKKTERLISDFEKEMKKYDIKTSFDTYHPHITLGRLKGKTNYGNLNYEKLSDFNTKEVVMCGVSR